MKLRWKILAIFVSLVAFGLGVLFYRILPSKAVEADKTMNAVIPHTPYEISDTAQALHDELVVADLHSDMLLWFRNPVIEHDYGHMDVPRLVKGGVNIQVFSSVTKTPSGLNYDTNTADSDDITLLAIAQRWPVNSWNSLLQRSVYHARRLHKLERRTRGLVRVVESREALEDTIGKSVNGQAVIAGILATEGAHPLEGKIENVDRLYNEGYRMLGLQHFFDNELGGSLHGRSGGGLTDFGKTVIQRMDERSMIIDVAHSSPAVVRDVLAMTDRPVVVSHTGIYSHCPSARNISDDLMKQIAAAGGLIGIGYWADVTCDASPDGVAAAIIAAVNLLGADHVALGSDFDGTVTVAMDTSELAALTQALIRRGMSRENIEKVMGRNAQRFFLENLPSDPDFKSKYAS